MSAGMSVTIEITFIPKVDEDIISKLSFLCSTAPFNIPIQCLTRKVTPSVSTNVIRFDNLVMGEVKKFGLKIFNNGAKPTKYYFVDPKTNKRIPNFEDEHPEAAGGASSSPAKSESSEQQHSDGGDDDYNNGGASGADIIYVKNEEEVSGVGLSSLG